MAQTDLLSENQKKELLIYEQLKTVIDPEVGINVVDLGLIYKIHYEEGHVRVEMTLSTPSCPLGDVIMEDIRNSVDKILPQIKVEIQLVWEPRWNPEFITPKGRELLGHPDRSGF